MNYQKIRTRGRQFESVTSLKVEEFDFLLSVFSNKWYNYYRIHRVNGQKRPSPNMNAKKDTQSLPSVEEKLFFILVYLKNYTTQQMTAASFDFSQSQASKWHKVLLPLLHSSLKELKMLPTRNGQRVVNILENIGENVCFQDASERLINRPSENTTQEVFYSGKKKRIQ